MKKYLSLLILLIAVVAYATPPSPPFSNNITGNAATATSLAANGANCNAGYAPLGVDASGAVESCTQYQAYDVDLTTWAGITPSANVQTFVSSADYATARTNLGLGTIATQNADAVAITAGNVTGLTSLSAATANVDHIAEKTGSHGVVFDNNVDIGSATAGKNVTVYATLGNEMAPALEAANWTATDGWSAGSGVLTKIAGTGTGTATPSGTFNIVQGRTYKVTMTVSAVSGTISYTLGGNVGRDLTATTFTDYITAVTTGKIIFSGAAATTVTITSLSVTEETVSTGDLTIYGKAKIAGGIWSENGQKAIDISPKGYIGIGGPSNRAYILDVVGSVYFENTLAVGTSVAVDTVANSSATTQLKIGTANTVRQVYGTTQQKHEIYNTSNSDSSPTNYERLSLTGVQGASVNITAETAGTGGDNLDVVITPAGTGAVKTGTAEVIDTHYDTIFIPASAMTPTATNGAVGSTAEYATNDINMDYLLFDGATEQYAEFQFPMPENWDRSTIKAKFFWSSDSGSTANDTVEWEIAGGALSNDDAIDAALGTAQVISDALLADNGTDLQVSGATPALTVGGTPALGDLVHFKVSRNVGGTDDMTENARLFGVWIQYKANTSVAAW